MRNKNKINITFKLTLFIFIIMIFSSFITLLISFILLEIFKLNFNIVRNPLFFLMSFLLASTLISSILTILGSKKSLKSFNIFLNGLNRVGKGDFNVQLDIENTKDIHKIYSTFNKMVRELNSIETLRSDFIQSFSHEFKTPIVSIRGFAKLAQDPKLSEQERNEYLNIIISESNRLVLLSNNTLMLTKLESQEFVIENKIFSLDEQIRQCILILQNEWESKNINLNINLEEILFLGNEELLQQLWINLINNAIKFTSENGEIVISSVKSNNNVITTITDNGMGMSEETLKHIFDKFYQGDSSRKMNGNGLGLSIAKRIVSLCGGTIEVHSKIDVGSTFVIIIPNNVDPIQLVK